MKPRALFRDEVVQAQNERGLGDVLVTLSPSISLFTAIAVLILIALIAFASLGHYTRKAHVSGYLVPDRGLIKMYAPAAGVLIEKRVAEGEDVKAGDTLFVLSTERGSPDTPAAQAAAIESIKQRRERLREELRNQDEIERNTRHTLAERLRGIERELEQLDTALRTQAQRLTSAQETAVRYGELAAKRYVSELQIRERREQVLDQQARLESMQRDRIALARDRDELRRALAGHAPEAANRRSAIAREIGTIEQQLTEYESRRHIVVTAPTAGTVTAILVEAGQTAAAGAALLSILPEETMFEAQLLVPSRAIGFVEPGQRVALRYEAFPYQRYGSAHGQIKEIARTLIIPGEVNLPIALREPAYRVTVRLDAQYVEAYRRRYALQAGMLLDADVWFDRRRIIEWVFDPLFSVMKKA